MRCFPVLAIFLILSSCAPRITSSLLVDLDGAGELPIDTVHNCNEALYYAPDSLTPMRYVRVNVHFMYDGKGQNNFSLEKGKKYMWSLISNANKRLLENEKMNLPPGNDTPRLPAQYQYRIQAQEGDDGYYTHQDEQLFYYVNKGKNQNNYDRQVIQKYGIGTDSIVNIFVMPHHPDSLASKNYKPHGTGVALGTSLKMAGLYDNDTPFWSFATLLNHEIGHILGLSHSWLKHDRCEDTPPHTNCWDNNGPPPCDSLVSNNMMDYNASQMAITPCQLGIVHKGFNKLNSKNRALLVKDWCHADTSGVILIDKPTHWKGARDVIKTIHVMEDVDFHVYCRLAMAKGARIVLAPGARLFLHDAMLHNDCGTTWGGIELQKRKDKEAMVYASDKSQLLHIEDASLSY